MTRGEILWKKVDLQVCRPSKWGGMKDTEPDTEERGQTGSLAWDQARGPRLGVTGYGAQARGPLL